MIVSEVAITPRSIVNTSNGVLDKLISRISPFSVALLLIIVSFPSFRISVSPFTDILLVYWPSSDVDNISGAPSRVRMLFGDRPNSFSCRESESFPSLLKAFHKFSLPLMVWIPESPSTIATMLINSIIQIPTVDWNRLFPQWLRLSSPDMVLLPIFSLARLVESNLFRVFCAFETERHSLACSLFLVFISQLEGCW